MAQKEKYAKKKEKTRALAARPWVLVCLLSLLLCGSVMGTIAYMKVNSSVDNAFTVGKLSVEVSENFDKKTKTNVTVKNTGNVDAYLRASIVVSWKDADGKILSDTPRENTDYTMTMGSDWTLGEDGYYYCKNSVASGANSPVLIKECRPMTLQSGKHLCVDILTQGVQATPSKAVKEQWDATVEDGILTPKGGETS